MSNCGVSALAAFVGSDAPRIARLAAKATPQQYGILYPLLDNSTGQAVKVTLEEIVNAQPAGALSETVRVALGRRRAGAAITLLRLGHGQTSCRAFQIQGDPESLTQFVHRCKDRAVTAGQLVACLNRSQDVHTRFAALLALGDYHLEELPQADRNGLVERLTRWYASDPSSAIHSATGWLLRQWGLTDEVIKVDRTPLPYDVSGEREWYVVEIEAKKSGTPFGSGLEKPETLPDDPVKLYFTLIVFQPGEYVMGSPDSEEDHTAEEQVHLVKLTRPIAVCDREMTWGQFNPQDRGGHQEAWKQQFGRALGDNDPVFGVAWNEAVDYCRWLTEQAGTPESDQCYVVPAVRPKGNTNDGMDWEIHFDRHGFRLLTEAEWEYVCRGGTTTTFGFGSDRSLLTHYGWFQDNSDKWSHTVAQKRPSLHGLFDIHGNMYEWCHDWYGNYGADDTEDPMGPPSGSSRVFRGGCGYDSAAGCRAARRDWNLPAYRGNDLGFRVALVPSASQAISASGAESGSR